MVRLPLYHLHFLLFFFLIFFSSSLSLSALRVIAPIKFRPLCAYNTTRFFFFFFIKISRRFCKYYQHDSGVTQYPPFSNLRPTTNVNRNQPYLGRKANLVENLQCRTQTLIKLINKPGQRRVNEGGKWGDGSGVGGWRNFLNQVKWREGSNVHHLGVLSAHSASRMHELNVPPY